MTNTKTVKLKVSVISGLSVLAFIGLKFKSAVLAALKLFSALKCGWLIQGFWTMFVSLWLYIVVFGWKFGLVIMVMLFVHEGGHWIAMKKAGLQPKMPIFIPFIGAYVAMSKMPQDEFIHAWVAYAGPLVGGLFAIAIYMIGLFSHTLWLMAGGAFGCMLNLFQLIPAWILDGKFIVTAISKWLLIPGTIILIALAFTLHSPLLIVISIGASVSLIRQFRHKASDQKEISYQQDVFDYGAKVTRTLDMVLTAEQKSSVEHKGTTISSNKGEEMLIGHPWQKVFVALAYVMLVSLLASAYTLENSQIADKMKAQGKVWTQGQNPVKLLLQ